VHNWEDNVDPVNSLTWSQLKQFTIANPFAFGINLNRDNLMASVD